MDGYKSGRAWKENRLLKNMSGNHLQQNSQNCVTIVASKLCTPQSPRLSLHFNRKATETLKKKILFSHYSIRNRSTFKICFKVPASNFKYERVFTLFHVLQTNCQATGRLLKHQFAQVSHTSPVFPSEAGEILVLTGVASAVNGSSFSPWHSICGFSPKEGSQLRDCGIWIDRSIFKGAFLTPQRQNAKHTSGKWCRKSILREPDLPNIQTGATFTLVKIS